MQQMLLGAIKSRILKRTFSDGGYTATRSTTTATTYTTRESVTTTESSGSSYACFWSAVADYDNTANDNRVQLLEGTTQRQLFNVEPKDIGDDYSFGGAYAYAGGTSRTFNIQHSAETAGDTSGIQALSSAVLKLEANDVFTTSAGTSTTTNGTTYQTKCSLSAPKAGYYVLIGSAAYNINTTGTTTAFEFRIGNATESDFQQCFNIYRKDTTNYIPANMVKIMYVANPNDNLVMQFLSDGTNTVSIREASLIALYIGITLDENADNFRKFYWAEAPFTVTTSSTSYTSGVEVAITNPSGNYHLVLASAQLGCDNTTYSASAKLERDGTTILHGVPFLIEPAGAPSSLGATQDYFLYVARIVTFTANTPTTLAWSFAAENAASVAYLTNATIAVMDLGVAP